MSSNDIGIDLGTTTVIIYDPSKGIVLKEPSVVAINSKDNEVLSVGSAAYDMIGRTPDKIRAIYPLINGIISDFTVTEEMIKYFIKKCCANSIVKPRVSICVPSKITDVESRAVLDVAIKAGARKVYLIEEPVAAAIGAGIDISKPNGNIILDIGGGTTDIAVLSLNGIVLKKSIRIAGNSFNEAIIKYIKNTHNVLIGEKMADSIKCKICSVFFKNDEDLETEIKGRNLLTGLPQKLTIKRSELCPTMLECCEPIILALQSVMEITPPELVADIFTNGLTMTGGGSLLHGLDMLIKHHLKIEAKLAPNPEDCVAIGTGKSFDYLDKLFDGFVNTSVYNHI